MHAAGRCEQSGRVLSGRNRLFEREIRAQLPADADPHAFVAIDVESGAFEVDEREVTAVDGLVDRHPDAREFCSGA
jgi:hypothetical protein